MKKQSLLLLVLLIAAIISTQAQSKKDVEANYASCTAAKDSLQKLYTGLSATYESLNKTYDSINKAYFAYDSMYQVIKEKVILHDFDPEKMSHLIDSLKTSRESAFSGIKSTLNDSITALKQENIKLKATIASLEAATQDNTKLVNDLKQLKELLDAQIITQEEFDGKKAKLLEQF